MSSRVLIPLLAIFMLGSCLQASASDPAQTEFEKANELYEKGKFTEAATALEQMLQAGEISSAVYFNLGNAYFKSGQSGLAILNYRLAARLAPRDPDVRANLQFARNSVNAPAGSVWWQRAIQRLTLNEWTMLTAGALWLSLLLLALGEWRADLKPLLRRPILASATALLILGTSLALACDARYRTASAIVIAREAVVRNGPLDESPSYYTVHDGTELEVLDSKGDWLQVADAARRTGWLRRQQVVKLGGDS